MGNQQSGSQPNAGQGQSGYRYHCAHHVALGLILLYGIANTALWYELDHRSVFSDEYFHRRAAFMAYEALCSHGEPIGERLWRAVCAGGFYPPLTYVYGIVPCWVFGKHIRSLRISSGLMLVIAMVCVFETLRCLGCGPWAGLLGGLTLSAIPAVVVIGRLFMNEAPVMATVALLYFLLAADPDLTDRRMSIFLGCVLGMGMLTKWTYFLYVAVPIGYCLARVWWPWANWGLRKEIPQEVRRSRGNTLMIAAIGLLIALPFYLRAETWRAWGGLQYQQTVGEARTPGILSWLLNLRDTISKMKYPYHSGGPFVWAPALLGLVGVAVRRPKAGFVIMAAGLGSLALLCIVSVNSYMRWLIPGLPAMAVLAAYGIACVRWKWVRCGMTCLTSLWIVVNTLASWSVYLIPTSGTYRWATYFFCYNILPPVRAADGSWQMEEIAEAIARDLGQRETAIAFMPFADGIEYNPAALHEYALDHAVNLRLTVDSKELNLAPLFNSDYLILRTAPPRSPYRTRVLYEVLRSVPQRFFNDNVTKLGDFSLRDGSTATLYRQNVCPTPDEQQIDVFQTLIERSPNLASEPHLLVELTARLLKVPQIVRFSALSDGVLAGLARALDSSQTAANLRPYLLGNYASWISHQDQRAQTRFTDYLENRILTPPANENGANEALGAGKVLADFYKRGSRIADARRISALLRERYGNRWEAWQIELPLATSDAEIDTILSKAATLPPPDSWPADPYFTRGDLSYFCRQLSAICIARGEYKTAEALLLKAAREMPGLAEACISLALNVYYRTGQFDKSLQWLQEARRRQPDMPFLEESIYTNWCDILRRAQARGNHVRTKGDLAAGFVVNLAHYALASASSEYRIYGTNYTPDNVKDNGPAEWATAGGNIGAWIQLTWDFPVTVERVALEARPRAQAHVLAGHLAFSDSGTTVPVGDLPEDGSPVTVDFDTRTVKWVRFVIDAVPPGTACAGLREFRVFGRKASAP